MTDTTVETTGKKEVSLKNTRHEKVRISVCLSARAHGTKLKPFIIFGGAKRESEALNKEFGSRCVLVLSPNGWMNESLTLKFVECVIGKFSFSRRLLAWDSFDSHTTDSVEKALRDCKVDSLVIPGGCTKYVQAPDIL